MQPRPIVYCETNWIVALAFPHHQHHRLARELRDQAHRGECEIRLPYAAVLEAPHPITEESKRLGNAFALLRDELANALQNGQADFAAIAASLGSDAMKQYLARPALDTVADLVKDPHIKLLRELEPALRKMDELRSGLNFRGKDRVDLYVLAAVVSDRLADGDMARTAIFFSTNKKEFQPKIEAQAKMGELFYEPYRIVWRSDFDLEPAVRHWKQQFMARPVMES